MTENSERTLTTDRNRGMEMINIETIIKNVITAESRAVMDQLNVIDMDAAAKVVDLFCDCRGKILVTGSGTSGAAAKKIAHTLCCIDRPAVYLNPADAPHGGLGVVAAGDVAVFLSKGGATPELVRLARICNERGAATVAVSEKDGTPLTDVCGIWLKVRVDREPDEFNMLATASTLSVISVMDAIAVCVMQKTGFSREDFAMIHPGGAVGEKLSEETDVIKFGEKKGA